MLRWPRGAPRSLRSPPTRERRRSTTRSCALERAGKTLDRVAAAFFVLAGADSNDALEEIERDIAPILARERDAILLNDALYARIEALHAARAALALDAEAARVLDRYRADFVRAGAGLAPEKKARLAAIGERLATLGAEFGQNVLADEKAFVLILDGPDDLAGLPESFLAAAARAAAERGHPGKHAVTLSRSSIEPFLQFSARRDLREKVFRAFLARGANGGAHDNGAIMSETARLRAERAALMGFPSYAHFRLDDTMAKTPEAALGLLEARLGAGARAGAARGRGAAGDDRRRGRQFRAEALGLALLRGKAPQGALRLRRERTEALSAAGIDDRGGVRRRPSPVRPLLRRAPRRRAPSRRRARLDGSRARAARRSPSSSATISPGPRSAAAPG